MLEAFAQVRRQVIELCDQQRFSTARLYLIGSGCPVETHTSLWEYIARRSDAAGNPSVARGIRKELWDAGVGSSDLALREADRLLEAQDFEAAEFLLDTTFGAETSNHEARRRLAQSYFQQAQKHSEGARLRTDRSRALKLAETFSFKVPTDAMVLVDLLRFSGELTLALEKNAQAREIFPNDVRFDTREARILEQMNNLSGAAKLWEQVAETSDRFRGEALLKLLSLYERLERHDELQQIRARLAIEDVSISDRLQLALAAGQTGMAHALAEFVGMGGPAVEQMPVSDAVSFAEQLLDSGETGLAVWLRRKRVPVGNRVKRVLDSMGFAVGGSRDLPDTVAEATEIRSPDFMLPLENTLKLKTKPRGWPGVGKDPKRVLLVNSALGIGGAERQFVELVRSLLENGLRKDQVHVAIYSLAEDRGHAYFLPQLNKLGVTVYDLANRATNTTALSGSETAMIDALPLAYRGDVRSLMALVEEIHPDVLHGWQDRSAAACGIVGIAKSVERIVLSARNMSPTTRKDKALVLNHALFSELASKDNVMISANSRLAASDYAEWLGCEKDRIDVIPNAIDMSLYPDLSLETGEKIVKGPVKIGGVFRLAINKRPLLWLQTIHSLRHDLGVELEPWLFGSGPLLRDVEEEAKRLGLDDLHLQSGVTDPAQIYGNLDTVLLMSQVEGLPNVLLEAQAMGKPVAACDVGGVKEAVKLGGKGAGLILPADVSAQDAAKQIAAWLPDALKAPANLIQRHIASQYDPKLLAQRTMANYRGQHGGRSS